MSKSDCKWAGEVVGVGWRGEVDPAGWYFSHFSVHLSHLGTLLKYKILI